MRRDGTGVRSWSVLVATAGMLILTSGFAVVFPSCRRADTCSMSGRVADLTTGTPIAGARVSLVVGGREVCATTGIAGMYGMQGAHEGSGTLVAQMEGYRPETTSVTVLAGEICQRDFYLARSGPARTGISGMVYDYRKEKPLPYALVSLPAMRIETYADSAGRFEITNLEPGIYALKLEKGGYEEYNTEARVHAGAVTALNLGMHKVAQGVSGKVYDVSDGTGVSGARIAISGSDDMCVSGSDGYYQAYLAPGVQRISVEKEGYAELETVFVSVAEEDFARLDLGLRPVGYGRGTFYGRITDEASGVGLQDARVLVRELQIQARSDEGGWYKIDDVPPGTYHIAALKEGYESYESDEVELEKGAYTSVNAGLKRGTQLTRERPIPRAELKDGSIFGRVVDDENEQPIRSAGVSIRRSGYSAVTDKKGCFSMSNIRPGTYDLVARAQGYQNTVIKGIRVELGSATPVDVRMKKRSFLGRFWRQSTSAGRRSRLSG